MIFVHTSSQSDRELFSINEPGHQSLYDGMVADDADQNFFVADSQLSSWHVMENQTKHWIKTIMIFFNTKNCSDRVLER